MASESLAAALASFYAKAGTIHETATAQYGKYADLSSVLSKVNPALASCGLAVTQTFNDDTEGRFLVTTLHHTSGQTVESRTKLVTEGGRGNPLHTWGGAVSYQRRYALLAMLNLAAGMEEDDGDSFSPVSKPPAQKPKPSIKPAATKSAPLQPDGPLDPPITADQLTELKETIPAMPSEFRDQLIKNFAAEFKTGAKPVSQCLTKLSHFNWIQSYLAAHPF